MKNLFNTHNLWIEDNVSSDTSLLFLQGGFGVTVVDDPSIDLAKIDSKSYHYVKFIKTFKKNSCKKVNFVSVKQFQHLNGTGDLNINNLKEAAKYNKTNIEILDKAINDQIIKGKKVILMGHSFGSMLIQEYISVYGTKKIQKAIICNIRLYNPLSTIFVKKPKNLRIVFKDKGQIDEIKPTSFPNGAILALEELLSKDYTKLLKGQDLSKVYYITSEGDSFAGTMSDYEENFVVKNGGHIKRLGFWRSKLIAKLIFSSKITANSIAHYIIFTPFIFGYLRKIINNNAQIYKNKSKKIKKIVKKHHDITKTNQIKIDKKLIELKSLYEKNTKHL